MVHLANPESTGGSASAEDELSECDMAALSSETKRNTQQNESMGEIAGHGVKAAWRTSRTRRLVTSSLSIVMIEIILSYRITTAISSCQI